MNKNLIVRAEYLADTDIGVKVHSKFLANCDATSIFNEFKDQEIDKEKAPFFVDLYDQNNSVIIETIGVSESEYIRVTGEVILSYSDYEKEAQFNQDLVFGGLEEMLSKDLEAQDKRIPWSEDQSFGLAAKRLQKFKQSDRSIFSMNVDDLEVGH